MVEERDLRLEAAASTIDLRRAAGLTAAIAFAALAPAAAVTLLDHSIRWLPWAFVIALGHVLLALPFFAALDRKGAVNAVTSIAAGLAIGVAPGALMLLLPLNATLNASTNGVPTIVNGVRTVAGWIDYFQMLALLGGCGALAGAVFWSTLRLCGWGRRDVTGSGGSGERPSRMLPIASVGLAIMLVAGVFAIPTITMGRTCHNMLRERTSIGPKVLVDLQVQIEDWPKLTETFERFANVHNLALKNSSQDQPGVVRILYLDLCTRQGTNISVNDQRWASKSYAAILRGHGTMIGVYAVHENPEWKQLARDFIADLQSEWPDKVRFLDGTSHVIPMPKELEQP